LALGFDAEMGADFLEGGLHATAGVEAAEDDLGRGIEIGAEERQRFAHPERHSGRHSAGVCTRVLTVTDTGIDWKQLGVRTVAVSVKKSSAISSGL
jgi:hypothetical protein